MLSFFRWLHYCIADECERHETSSSIPLSFFSLKYNIYALLICIEHFHGFIEPQLIKIINKVNFFSKLQFFSDIKYFLRFSRPTKKSAIYCLISWMRYWNLGNYTFEKSTGSGEKGMYLRSFDFQRSLFSIFLEVSETWLA